MPVFSIIFIATRSTNTRETKNFYVLDIDLRYGRSYIYYEILQSSSIDPHRQRKTSTKTNGSLKGGDAVDHSSYETKHTSLTVSQLVEG